MIWLWFQWLLHFEYPHHQKLWCIRYPTCKFAILYFHLLAQFANICTTVKVSWLYIDYSNPFTDIPTDTHPTSLSDIFWNIHWRLWWHVVTCHLTDICIGIYACISTGIYSDISYLWHFCWHIEWHMLGHLDGLLYRHLDWRMYVRYSDISADILTYWVRTVHWYRRAVVIRRTSVYLRVTGGRKSRGRKVDPRICKQGEGWWKDSHGAL